MAKNITFGLTFASRKFVLKHNIIMSEIIEHVIKIDPADIILTDKSNLFNLAKEEDFIKDTFNYFNLKLTSEQFHSIEMSVFIKLIINERKRQKKSKKQTLPDVKKHKEK